MDPVRGADLRPQSRGVPEKDDADGLDPVDGQHISESVLVPVAEKHHLGYLSTV